VGWAYIHSLQFAKNINKTMKKNGIKTRIVHFKEQYANQNNKIGEEARESGGGNNGEVKTSASGVEKDVGGNENVKRKERERCFFERTLP
jgi:hypothetical protein